ncbi:glutathione S-transferase [Henriciella pelagia]|uniref:Glutathione S-transferase n=1 Tax=Henriciella pelagia TaxID=1977912 RepID=A0ABQ1JMQ6_9PROT|nr:glutathione S-transferase [Henriciella pelagia]GGB69727.1 glutathione S-transferase [Henriciella pelagia]
MAGPQTIILHHYETSPFSEKIRLILRMKNLGWSSVEIPSIMPKPLLIPLTGGYRKTPVLQIGADIFCDSAMIIRALEERFPLPSIDLPGHEGLSNMIAAWTDGKWFQTSVGVIFGALGDKVPDAFKKDREKMSGRPFDTKAMAAAAPMLQDQWRAQLMWIEERLEGGQGAGAGQWIIGMKPGLVDAHVFMNPWFVEKNVPDFLEACFKSAPRTRDWYQRMKEIEGQEPEEITGEQALKIARDAAPRLKAAKTVGELQGFEPGERVAVAPDDYGRDWVEGEIVIATAERIILHRHDDQAETVNVHFPRTGFMVRRLD